MFSFEDYKEKFLAAWNNLIQKSDEGEIAEMGRERIVVFIVALILALCLWLLVNLSRDYNLNINLPISLGAIPEEQALASSLPDNATVSVSGEGWKLINLYNNPPEINLDINNSEVNVYDQVQQQMNVIPEVSVQKVQPLVLTLDLEERVDKKIPLRSRVEVSFRNQYDFLEPPRLKPDSVIVSGAKSLVQNITEWRTEPVQLTNVSGDISETVNLEEPGELITLGRNEVTFEARVSQYTEGEAEVDVEVRGLPSGRSISFSPSTITVRYNVPIDEYNELQDLNPFEAYITYSQIQQDSTGFLRPQIEQTTDDFHIEIRSSQPRRVAYFMIVDS